MSTAGGVMMTNEINTRVTVKSLLSNVNYKKRFEEILGDRASGFMSSIINLANSEDLRDADPQSVVACAVVAATLDLPIDKNLGHAWIVPFKSKGVKKAQFQMSAKGFVQLAQRSGQYTRLSKGKVYENQFKSWNPFTEVLDADFSVRGEGQVIGYFGYFKLLNGFEKTTFWYRDDVEKHARKYSKTFNNGPWQTEFDQMAEKTVIKFILKDYGPLSIQMQQAMITDQAVISEGIVDTRDIEGSIEYPDNPNNDATITPESEAIRRMKEKAKDVEFTNVEGTGDMGDEDIPEIFKEAMLSE